MKTIKYILAGAFTITFLVSCDTYYDGYAYRRNPNRYDNSYYYNGREYKNCLQDRQKKCMVDLQKIMLLGQRKNIIAMMINFSL